MKHKGQNQHRLKEDAQQTHQTLTKKGKNKQTTTNTSRTTNMERRQNKNKSRKGKKTKHKKEEQGNKTTITIVGSAPSWASLPAR
jgi:precorrin isomerase